MAEGFAATARTAVIGMEKSIMKLPVRLLTIAFPLLLLFGCVTVPTGPSVMALPGSGKTFDQFRNDDMDCRQYAQYQTGGMSTEQTAMNAGVSSAVVGTVIGAVAGAAIGGHDGAAVGAGTGLLVGSMAGSGAAQSSAYGSQRNYDNAYIQCMYAKGERVPVPMSMARPIRSSQPASPQPNPPTEATLPPPPPGLPPPPPPGALTR